MSSHEHCTNMLKTKHNKVSKLYLQVIDFLLLLVDIHVQDLILVGQFLEIMGALSGLLQIVKMGSLEQLLQVLDLRVQRNAQHVDFFEVLVADLFPQLLKLVLCL